MRRISLLLALVASAFLGCGSEPSSVPFDALDATPDSGLPDVGGDATGDAFHTQDGASDVFLDHPTESGCASGYEVDGSCVACRNDLDCAAFEHCENDACVPREPCTPLQPCAVGDCVDGLCRDCAAGGNCTAPPGLACFATHYSGVPVSGPAGWTLQLPDGTELVWDDGRTKSFQELLDEPDLEDTIAIPYATGPILPVSTVDFDPGRFRVQRLFEVTYGASESEVSSHLVSVDFMRNVAGYSVPFHERAAAALTRVSDRLQAAFALDPSLAVFLDDPGTFAWRPIANTNRLSPHSFGIALDTGVSHAYYWAWDPSIVWQNQHPQTIVDAFEAEGFIWGGRWYHYDTMHFEYRPELLDPACN